MSEVVLAKEGWLMRASLVKRASQRYGYEARGWSNSLLITDRFAELDRALGGPAATRRLAAGRLWTGTVSGGATVGGAAGEADMGSAQDGPEESGDSRCRNEGKNVYMLTT